MSAEPQWFPAAPGLMLRHFEEGGAHLSDGTGTVYVRPEALIDLGRALIAARVVQVRTKSDKTARERGAHRKKKED